MSEANSSVEAPGSAAIASPPKHLNAIRLWLALIVVMIGCMVIVGGATRLTDSGLSITEWQPLLGAIPPLDESHWQEAFAKYKQIPEYQILNRGMSLDEFKFIYWWEWAHRFLGRAIGVVVLVPLIVFALRRMLDRLLIIRLAIIFVLGGLQGALGWYMVASGLTERTDVSQYRLSAHLTLAFILFGAVLWTFYGLGGGRQRRSLAGLAWPLMLLGLIYVQVALGGFVAGLDAGHASYTWPLMEGKIIPDGLWSHDPLWRNLFENVLTLQFNHRLLAYVIVILALVHAWRSEHTTAWLLLAALCGQMFIGVLTLITHVEIGVALLHQAGALVVVALALWHIHVLMRRTVN